MRNGEIAAALDELGTLYELDGAVRYRVLAYREAARVIRSHPTSIAELARSGKLTELPGIGSTIETKVITLLDEGSLPQTEKLKQKFPPTLIEVTRIPGLGAKTARRFYDELGIADLEGLEAAARNGELSSMKGFGEKAERNLLAEIEKLGEEGPTVRVLLAEALEVAEELAEALRELPEADRVTIAGSARRMAETCKDVDLIATASDPGALAKVLQKHPLVAQAGRGGDAAAKVLTHSGLSVDLRISPPEAYGNLLQHFTGSAEHNVQLRERALAMDLSVSELGIARVEEGKRAEGAELFATEEEVYGRLGLDYIEPELREGRGELDAAATGELPELVTEADIRGDLHCHTTLSDGKNSLEEMAAAARERGYEYLAITDHSASHGFGNHVTDEQLAARIEEIREWNKGKRVFRLLAGSEVNILPDGSLDYPDELLAELDWVIASVHTAFRSSEKQMTRRVITAIENPMVDCIGHLTGRLILRREPYDVDVEQVAAAAARTGTMLEINGNPNRRDLSERHARLAVESGATIVANTDAHQIRTLGNMRFGIATARRAWLNRDQIANTRPWGEFEKLRKRA
ncbi:MAG TPA: DNA polymerase/3'-5' exonuclease PolX [Solirubrobacterales bacterium]